MITDALRLSVYFGDSVTCGPRLASDALMASLGDRVVASALLRGIEGFGLNRRLHAERFPDVSTDLPLLGVAVVEHERIGPALEEVDRTVPRGLVTLEHVRLARGSDVADAEFPCGPGRAGTLTVHCGAEERSAGRPAYRQVVALLRRSGASGAIVLPGVDGWLHGRRRRARLFSSRHVPMLIVSVGEREPLRRSLRNLCDVLVDPVATLEATTQIKHDGRLLESLPRPSRSQEGVWQAVRVLTRRSAEVDGRALYSELTRRLREAGAAGATTVLGDWGFSSDEPPHGDKLGRVASHRPTYSVYVDRPEAVARSWRLIDELTAEHALVTSALVPAYRERAEGEGAAPLGSRLPA